MKKNLTNWIFFKKRLSHQKDIRKDIENVLSKNEQKQLNAIWSHFKGFKHMSKEHYYSLFDALIIFGSEKVNKCNLERCTQAGIIPSFQVVYFNEHEGTVLLIDTKQIEIMICKSNDTLQNSFLKYYASRIDEKDVENIFKRRKNLLKKILAYNKIVNRLGCNFDYYFLFCASFEYDSFNLDIFNPLANKALPNNYKFLKMKQNNDKSNKKIAQYEKTLKKYKKYLIQFDTIVQILEEKYNQENSPNESQKEDSLVNQKIDINLLSDDEICEYTFYSLAKIKELIQKSVFESENKKMNILSEVSQRLNKSINEKNSDMIMDLLSDIINHTKYKSWNLKVLEFAFLIKYCSSAAYFRLFIMMGKLLPPPETIDSHFRSAIQKREKLLLNVDDFNKLLNQYLEDIKDKIDEYVKEYNETFKTNITRETFKIQLCISCDAASLTPFTQQRKANKKKAKANKKAEKKNNIY